MSSPSSAKQQKKAGIIAASLFPDLKGMYVDVALGIPQDEPYQYSVPPNLIKQAQLGKRVLVPLRTQSKIGYIVGISDTPQAENLKPIREIIDEESFISTALLNLTRWIADYYFCSWGQAIESAMPGPFRQGKTTMRTRKTKINEESLIHATPIHQLTRDQKIIVDEKIGTFNVLNIGDVLDKKSD